MRDFFVASLPFFIARFTIPGWEQFFLLIMLAAGTTMGRLLPEISQVIAKNA